MFDTYARIQTFLQHQTIARLVDDVVIFPDQQYMKAGVVPYVRGPSGFLYLVMKPVAKRKELVPPGFQICKGTRMYLHRGSGWRDMKAGDEGVTYKEDLVTTALREGIEEVGLRLEAVTAMQEVGPYRFKSEKTGKNKYMWLYTAELTSQDDVLPMEAIATATAERGWLASEEFNVVGREDHKYIVEDIGKKLEIYYRGCRGS